MQKSQFSSSRWFARVIDARKQRVPGAAMAMRRRAGRGNGMTFNRVDAVGLRGRIEAEDFFRTRIETICALGLLRDRIRERDISQERS
jgi:hypothetical protein